MKNSTAKLSEPLRKQAFKDIESNIVTVDGHRYFGAGKTFGIRLYTRDISFAGVFGCNAHYPEVMWDSLRETRRVHLDAHPWICSANHHVPAIPGPWNVQDCTEKELADRTHTNSWTRRTDDVIWLWACHDLFLRHPQMADWKWLLETGTRCFDELYAPFARPDGLFCGQQCFVDVQDGPGGGPLGGYPVSFSLSDCVTIAALSTNCLYLRGMEALADAAKHCGQSPTAWETKAADLRTAILKELRAPEGHLCVFKEANGRLETRRDALGLALAVRFGILKGDDARHSFKDYPRQPWGVPLWDKYWPHDHFYHNHSSWPFADIFFLQALEQVDGESHRDEMVHILARSTSTDGTFHELTDYRNGDIHGSGSQLWTAAAYLDVSNR